MAIFGIQRKGSLPASPHGVGLPKKKPLITQGLKLAGNGGIRTKSLKTIEIKILNFIFFK
jgi:hypothetical protein